MRRICAVTVIALAVTGIAQAQLSLTFDSDVQGVAGASWVAAGPGGSAMIQANAAAGGWTMGSTGMKKEYSWGFGQQEITALLGNPGAKLDFDLYLDGSSFPNDAGTWFSVNMAGNSDGAQGWTQIEHLTAGWEWRNQGEMTLHTYHITKTFAQLAWQPGDTWFQIFLGSNSDADKPIRFYVDNIIITPEPATGLILLGGLALVVRRRRA